MSQFAAAKSPPWARSAPGQPQPQVATTLLHQQGVGTATIYTIAATTPTLAQPQYAAQQLATVTLQSQPQAALQPATVLPQPGIAIPTSLATTTQVASVSYPPPRVTQPQGPKQRVFTGTVTKLHENFGFVDEEIFFQTNSVKGNMAKVGDRVLVEATFNANMPFKWNAVRIQVLPNQPVMASPLVATPGMNLMKMTSQTVAVTAVPQSMGTAPLGLAGTVVTPTIAQTPLMAAAITPTITPSIAPVPPPNQALTQQPPPPLMGQIRHSQPAGGIIPGPGAIRGPLQASRRNDVGRFDRDREREREKDRERERRDRRDVKPFLKRSRSPPNRQSHSPVSRARSPGRRRVPRIVPRYVVQIPKLSLDMKEANVITLKSRYNNLYIPSDFFTAAFAWTEAFPLSRPFKLGMECNFHVMQKDVEPLLTVETNLEPTDADHLYSAKVMLLSNPRLEEIFHKCCALGEDTLENRDQFQHPTRLIQFLVGLKGKNEPMAIGGPWSPSLDGANPTEDPRTLINTAIRTTKALTNIDLSGCTQWYRFAEICYIRREEMHKGRLLPSRVETVVIFFPDVWSIIPTRLEWDSLQTAYKRRLQKVLTGGSSSSSSSSSGDTKDDYTQDKEEEEAETDEKEPTHFSELDPKSMKIVDLRRELEYRNLSLKGLKSQLIARLTKAVKMEQEKEEEEAETKEVEVKGESEGKTETDEKDDDVKKEPEDDKKKKEEKEKVALERKYTLPDNPVVIVHPSPTAKAGKFDCTVMSLSVLLDYRPEDNKEHSFEVSLFAELFNEMLMRDLGFRIYKGLMLAPDKKEDDKEKRDKEKRKVEDKSVKEPLNKRKKLDDKEEKENDKKDIKDKVKVDEKIEKLVRVEKFEESNGNNEDADEEEEDEDDDEQRENDKKDKGKKDKEKKKERKKYYTADPYLLLAFVYFDQNHTGYLLDKDLEEIIHTVGLHLSRAQVKKLVQKLVSRDTLNYRKLTDRPKVDDAEMNNEEEVNDEEKLAQGNIQHLASKKHPKDLLGTKGSKCGVKNGNESSGIIRYKGALLDIESITQRLEKSEQTRSMLETMLQTMSQEIEMLKSKMLKSSETNQQLESEVMTLKKELEDEAQVTLVSQAESKHYHSTLKQSEKSLISVLKGITQALEKKVKVERKNKNDSNSSCVVTSE